MISSGAAGWYAFHPKINVLSKEAVMALGNGISLGMVILVALAAVALVGTCLHRSRRVSRFAPISLMMLVVGLVGIGVGISMTNTAAATVIAAELGLSADSASLISSNDPVVRREVQCLITDRIRQLDNELEAATKERAQSYKNSLPAGTKNQEANLLALSQRSFWRKEVEVKRQNFVDAARELDYLAWP